MTRCGSHAAAAILWATAVPLGLGCGAAPEARDAGTGVDAANPAQTVCDGTATLRVMMTVVNPEYRVLYGHRVMRENGAWYVLIDGRCRYWASYPEELWAELRTGTLDGETLGWLLADLHYDRWDELQGVYPPAPGVSDVSDAVFSDGERRIVCVGGCGADVVPDEVKAMGNAVTPWATRLWESGTPVGSDVRVLVVGSGMEGEAVDLIQKSSWPVAGVGLHEIAIPYSEAEATISYGDGVRVTGTDADALRRLRSEYMADEHGVWWYRYIPIVDDAGALHELYFRDTSPFENDRGLIGWLHDPWTGP